MKKNIFLFLFISVISIVSCSKKDDFSAKAMIKILKNEQPQESVTVYMFRDNRGPDSELFTPIYSKRKSITESDGIATFELRETFDLNVIDTQTTLYFAVFDGEEAIGHTAMTIKKGETKEAIIQL